LAGPFQPRVVWPSALDTDPVVSGPALAVASRHFPPGDFLHQPDLLPPGFSVFFFFAAALPDGPFRTVKSKIRDALLRCIRNRTGPICPRTSGPKVLGRGTPISTMGHRLTARLSHPFLPDAAGYPERPSSPRGRVFSRPRPAFFLQQLAFFCRFVPPRGRVTFPHKIQIRGFSPGLHKGTSSTLGPPPPSLAAHPLHDKGPTAETAGPAPRLTPPLPCSLNDTDFFKCNPPAPHRDQAHWPPPCATTPIVPRSKAAPDPVSDLFISPFPPPRVPSHPGRALGHRLSLICPYSLRPSVSPTYAS